MRKTIHLNREKHPFETPSGLSARLCYLYTCILGYDRLNFKYNRTIEESSMHQSADIFNEYKTYKLFN